MAEKTIGGRQYRAIPLRATEAIMLQARLLKVVGPGLAHLKSVMEGVGKDKEGNEKDDKAKDRAAGVALEAFGNIVANADPVVVVNLMRDLIATVQLRRPSGDYDICDIDGDFVEEQRKFVYPVAIYAIQEQFGDFFGELPGLGRLASAARN